MCAGWLVRIHKIYIEENVRIMKINKDADFVPVVLGADVLGYSYAREFYRIYGVKSFMLSGVKASYSMYSKFTDYHRVPGIDEEDVLIGWLREHRDSWGGKTPIVHCGAGDWRVRALSKHKQELTEWGYVIPNIDFELLDSISQKDVFYSACSRLGVPFPRTWAFCFHGYTMEEGERLTVLHDPEEVRALDYPLIAKPSNSADWHFAEFPNKHKVYTISDADELIKVIRDLEASTYSHALLIQEMCSTADEALHTITTFSDAEGNMLVGVTGDVLLQSHTKSGIGNPMVILGRGSDRKLLEYAGRLLKEWKYEGFANMDVMDDKDGNPCFLEINTRPGRNTYYYSLAGCPFVKPQVEYFVHGQHKLESMTEAERRADRPFLFTLVSEELVGKVAHGAKREAALAHYADGTAANPMICKEDTLLQKFFAKRYVKFVEGIEAKLV